MLRDPDSGLEPRVPSPTSYPSGLEFVRNVLSALSTTGLFPPLNPGAAGYLVVDDGQLAVIVAEEQLGEREALYLRADRPHAFRNPAGTPYIYYPGYPSTFGLTGRTGPPAPAGCRRGSAVARKRPGGRSDSGQTGRPIGGWRE